MHCLKCGTEVGEPEVFCPRCLENMEKCPVSRETPVVILPRPEQRERRQRPVRVEELLAQTRRRLKRMLIVSIVLALLCVGLTVLLFLSQEENARPIGQNYITNTGEGTDGTP